jgi:hypothetical protein
MLRLAQKSAALGLPLLIMVLWIGAALAQSVPGTAQPGATAAPSQGNVPAQHHQSGKHSKSAQPVAQVAPPPAPPPTPEQMAPVAPKVSYSGGQLTIQSQNATLAQVLRAVGSKTGASIDIPSGANSDRVVAQLGPGQPSDVLSSLLNGSRFNYIILGVPSQPGSVQRVVLTLRQSTPATTSVAQNQSVQQPPQQQEDDYIPPEPTPADDNSAGNQPTPPGAYRGPGAYIPPQNAEFPAPQPSPDGNVQAPQGVKTPEQLLQELQRIQQQQQQYQQQLNPANQNIPQPYQQPQ